MDHTEGDLGDTIYTEERNLFRERSKYFFIGIVTLSVVLLVLYVSALESAQLALFAFLASLVLLYPAILAILLSHSGIRNLTVYDKGFVPPYCANPSINHNRHGFIPWREVASIYANKNLRISDIFPFIVVKMREGSFAIPADQIQNMNLFLTSVSPYTEVIKKEEYRNGIAPITYYPPSREARLDDDAIVLSYTDREEVLPFKDIKKIRVRMSHQLVMTNGKRIGMLGMSREDVQRIKETITKGGVTSGDAEGGLTKPQGLLGSSSEEIDDGELGG